jgi:hypothetical protein
MGVVLHARAQDGRDLAVKVLLDPNKTGAADRFERERRLLVALGEAEGFVPLLDSGVSPFGPWIAMPFVGGGTLRDRLSRGRLDLREAIAVAIEIARAIGRAHERGIVHRDLKPENVLFTDTGRPLIADLGLAKHFRQDVDGASQSVALTLSGEFRGTATYMSPEQMTDSKSVGPATDVFALGAIIYECVSGKATFSGGSALEVLARVQSGEFEPLRLLAPDTPRWLESVVTRALAHEPADRFPDGTALARALERRDAGRGRWVAAIATAAAIAIVAGVVATRPRREQPRAAPALESPTTDPEVERATKLAASGDAEGALAAWEKILHADGPKPPADHASVAWSAALSAADHRLDRDGAAAALDVVKKMKALAPDEPPEVALFRARVQLGGIVFPPTGRSERSGETIEREKKVRELLGAHRGAARGKTAWAAALEDLGVFRVTCDDANASGGVPSAKIQLAQARPHMLAAQDAQPGRVLRTEYASVVARWALWSKARLDVIGAAREFDASPAPFAQGTVARALDRARDVAVRARVEQLRAGNDPALLAKAREIATEAKKQLDELRANSEEAGDNPIWLDGTMRVRTVLGDLDGALVAGERALAAFASWETLLETSRLRAARGELDPALEDADIAARAIEYESLEPGVDVSAVVGRRQRLAVVAYRHRAAIKRLRGWEEGAKDDERLLKKARDWADELKLPPILYE